MVVRKPSMAKRETRRMPETPPVSFAQLSAAPTPSEVTTPIPVTATMGRPFLSCVALVMRFPFCSVQARYAKPEAGFRGRSCSAKHSLHAFNQRQTLAAPIADPGHDHLRQVRWTFPEIPRSRRREQLAMLDRRAGNPDIGNELGLHAMTDIRTGIANRKADLPERDLLGRRRGLEPRRAGNDGGVRAVDLIGDGRPFLPQGCFDFAGLATIAIGAHSREPSMRARAARLRVLAALQHQDGAHIA